MHYVSPPEVASLSLSSLAGHHPIADATIALVLFLAAISVIGSAIWLALRQSRG